MQKHYRLGGWESADLKAHRTDTHGERGYKIRRKFFKSIAKKYLKMLDKSNER